VPPTTSGKEVLLKNVSTLDKEFAMSKEEEIKILKDAINKLGKDSYLAPALADFLPWVAREVRCDIIPDILGHFNFLEKEIDRRKEEAKELAAKVAAINELVKSREYELRRTEDELSRLYDKAKDNLVSIRDIANRSVNRGA